MTTMTNEQTVLDALPTVTLTRHLSEGLAESAVFPFVHCDNVPSGYVGLIASIESSGHMWRISDGEIRNHPGLAPYRDLYGWWVRESEIDRVPEQITAPVSTDFSDVPAEHQSTIPLGARWGVLTGMSAFQQAERGRTIIPDGRYLAVKHNDEDVLCLWPGHPLFDAGLDRSRRGVPRPWNGFRVSSGAVRGGVTFVEETTAPVNDRLSEVPEEHRHLIPADARWGRTTRSIDGLPPGRFLARPSLNEGTLVVITWPGHDHYMVTGNRETHGIPLPLHGYNTYRPADFEFDPEVNEPTLTADFAELARLNAEVTRLTEALAAMESQSNTHSRELANVRQRYDSDLNEIGRILRDEANDRDWEEEMVDVVERLNNNLYGDIDYAPPMVDVTIQLRSTVEVPVTASITVQLPAGYDGNAVEEAMSDWIGDNNIWNADNVETGDPDWDSHNDDRVEVSEYETD